MKINKILDELKNLTLIECVELIKEIEIVFNINTLNSLPLTKGNYKIESDLEKKEIEEKLNFNVLLSEVPSDKKIAILKVVRSITGLGLKESKEIIDNVPKVIKEGLTKSECDSIKEQLESAGGKILIQ